MQRVHGAEVRLLTQRCVLGRSRACTIRLEDPDVSGEHALLRWTGSVWEVQDLHSRNGTFVDRIRLAPGERTALAGGAVLGFGHLESFVLVDAAGPTMFAELIGGGEPVEARGGILALPGPNAPELMVFRGVGCWMVERGGATAEVADGEVLRSDGEVWLLHLPEPLPQTVKAIAGAPELDDLTLRFTVSRDEEYIELVAVSARGTIDLKARSHHYTLLVLARARLRDQALAPELQGWVHQSDLLDLMRVDGSHLHLNIYRLRHQFGEAGIAGAGRIVERRPGTRQIRVGTAKLEILARDQDR